MVNGELGECDRTAIGRFDSKLDESSEQPCERPNKKYNFNSFAEILLDLDGMEWKTKCSTTNKLCTVHCAMHLPQNVSCAIRCSVRRCCTLLN